MADARSVASLLSLGAGNNARLRISAQGDDAQDAISALLGTSAVAVTEVSPGFALLILVGVVASVLYGAKRLGIFHLNNTAHTH